MDLTWSAIEDLARTSDDAAVRKRFDHRNLRWLTVLLIFFTFAAVVSVADDPERKAPVTVGIGALNLAVVALFLFALWSPSLRAWTRRRMSAMTITFVTVEYALWLAYTRDTRDWIGWASTLPWMMLGFRMAPTELVLLHSILATGGVLMLFLGAPMPDGEKAAIAILVINVFSLLINLYFSRRMRRQVVDDLTERRAHAREQLRMREELQYARELQLSMLPECAPSLPWADICSISIPATEVGGDYYDYFVEDNRVALVCGDVAGHGMGAGLVLAGLRSGFTLLRASLHDPAAVLRRLHDLVTQTSRRRMLVTVAVVLVDGASRRATIANAAHPPVILRRADGSVQTIDLYAPPLGVRLPVQIPQRTFDVGPGDVFVLHSDGIYETRRADGEHYGLERLMEIVRTHGTATAEQLRDAIVRDVTAFRGSAEATDDVTVVVCRLT